jgi:hypothetical protein
LANAILYYYEGCKTKKRRKQRQLFFIFVFFWCEWQKQIRVSKEGVLYNIAYCMNGLIFLALLEK